MAKNILLPSYTGVTAMTDFGIYGLIILTTEEMADRWHGESDAITGNVFVVFDGVTYECPQQKLAIVGDAMVVGNATAFGGTGNNEPFIITIRYRVMDNWNYGEWLVGALADTAPTEHTVEIYQVEASTAFAVVLKDRSGADVTYEVPSEQIKLNTPTGTQIFTAGQSIENVPITLDLADGDQTINAPDGYLVKSAVIQKPTTLVPANIVKDVDIAGVVGTFEGGGGSDAILAGLIDNTVTEIVIPEGATKIRDYAFYNCTSLTSITIPDSVTSIGNYAFRGCTSLASITIPESVTKIGTYAFYNCTKLLKATFKDTSGWYVSTSSTATSGTPLPSSSLASTSTAAMYLRSTYYDRYWFNT